MRRLGFPATSPWFYRSLLTEYTDEDIAAMEPRGATLTGIADRTGRLKTAQIRVGASTYEATAQSAPEALRLALRKLHEAERVEVVSLLSGPAA